MTYHISAITTLILVTTTYQAQPDLAEAIERLAQELSTVKELVQQASVEVYACGHILRMVLCMALFIDIKQTVYSSRLAERRMNTNMCLVR